MTFCLFKCFCYSFTSQVLFLHGEPGTGKTSLCQALSHKLAIRLCHTFPSGGLLIEVNSHSLFSKWFSESGKRILKMFDKIRAEASDAQRLIVVLIDEVRLLLPTRKYMHQRARQCHPCHDSSHHHYNELAIDISPPCQTDIIYMYIHFVVCCLC